MIVSLLLDAVALAGAFGCGVGVLKLPMFSVAKKVDPLAQYSTDEVPVIPFTKFWEEGYRSDNNGYECPACGRGWYKNDGHLHPLCLCESYPFQHFHLACYSTNDTETVKHGCGAKFVMLAKNVKL